MNKYDAFKIDNEFNVYGRVNGEWEFIVKEENRDYAIGRMKYEQFLCCQFGIKMYDENGEEVA